jgi:hypothetical protein
MQNLKTASGSRLLPGEIIARKKKGFSIPFYIWMKTGMMAGSYPRSAFIPEYESLYEEFDDLKKYFLLAFASWAAGSV